MKKSCRNKISVATPEAVPGCSRPPFLILPCVVRALPSSQPCAGRLARSAAQLFLPVPWNSSPPRRYTLGLPETPQPAGQLVLFFVLPATLAIHPCQAMLSGQATTCHATAVTPRFLCDRPALPRTPTYFPECPADRLPADWTLQPTSQSASQPSLIQRHSEPATNNE